MIQENSQYKQQSNSKLSDNENSNTKNWHRTKQYFDRNELDESKEYFNAEEIEKG